MTAPPADPTPTWTFARHDQQLTIRRPTDTTLVISGAADDERKFSFESIQELMSFQEGFESHLIETGWSLVGFSPERRSGRDRRAIPRKAPERRRRPFPFFRRS